MSTVPSTVFAGEPISAGSNPVQAGTVATAGSTQPSGTVTQTQATSQQPGDPTGSPLASHGQLQTGAAVSSATGVSHPPSQKSRSRPSSNHNVPYDLKSQPQYHSHYQQQSTQQQHKFQHNMHHNQMQHKSNGAGMQHTGMVKSNYMQQPQTHQAMTYPATGQPLMFATYTAQPLSSAAGPTTQAMPMGSAAPAGAIPTTGYSAYAYPPQTGSPSLQQQQQAGVMGGPAIPMAGANPTIPGAPGAGGKCV